MCNFFWDLFIGIIAGLISGFIVSVFLNAKMEKEKHKYQFKRDKQLYCRYIQLIRTELILGYKVNDYDFLIRAIEDEPIRESFENLTGSSQDIMERANLLLTEIKNKVLECECTITENEYRGFLSKLLKVSIDVLKITEAN